MLYANLFPSLPMQCLLYALAIRDMPSHSSVPVARQQQFAQCALLQIKPPFAIKQMQMHNRVQQFKLRVMAIFAACHSYYSSRWLNYGQLLARLNLCLRGGLGARGVGGKDIACVGCTCTLCGREERRHCGGVNEFHSANIAKTLPRFSGKG